MVNEQKLKPRTYYIIEIKFSENNSIHRCIMATGSGNKENIPTDCELYSRSYENIQRMDIKNIYWFKVIKELPEMKNS